MSLPTGELPETTGADQGLAPTHVDDDLTLPSLDEVRLARVVRDSALIPEARALGVASIVLDHVANVYRTDRSLWPSAQDLSDYNYYEVADYLNATRKEPETAIFLEIINEELDEAIPIYRAIAQFAEKVERMLTLGRAGSIGAITLKIWATDEADIELPSMFEELSKRARAAAIKRRNIHGYRI